MRYKRRRSYLSIITIGEVLRRLALRRVPGPEALRHSLRAISRELRIDRETVRAFDRGAYSFQHRGYARCKTCGHEVLLPCGVCAARLAAAA